MGTTAGLKALIGVAGRAGYQNFVKTAETAAKTGISKTPVGFYAALAVCALAGVGAVGHLASNGSSGNASDIAITKIKGYICTGYAIFHL